MKTVFLALAILLIPAISQAQSARDAALPVGVVIPRVSIKSDGNQSYAAYLPSNYSASKKWPTLFCFDPLARGRFAVEHFQAVAEKYGYIVVCSNNSRNGLDSATTLRYVTAFDLDVHERFNVDRARTYLAGFSGGARLALGIASRCGQCVAGVIAAGAGFPEGLSPTSDLKFAIFGAAGFDDFNYDELRALQIKLDELSVTARVVTFAGAHEWMDQATADAALAWFDLLSRKTGSLARDDAFRAGQLDLRRARAERAVAEQRFIDAYYDYRSLLSDFGDRVQLAPFVEAAQRLRNSPEYKKELSAERDLVARRRLAMRELFTLWAGRPADVDNLVPRPEAETRIRISDWRRLRDGTTDTADRRLARRILNGAFIGAIESAQTYLAQKNLSLAAHYFELAMAIEPRQAGIAYELARVYALDGRKKLALQSLERAFELGFKNVDQLKNEKAFAILAKESRFIQLVIPH